MDFKKRLAKGEALHGVLVTMSDSCVSEVLSECGFDWLWIDMEHTPLSLREVETMVHAKNKMCSAFVRIPLNSEEWIKRVLDLGVEGIIIPHVNYAEDVKKAIIASYYPPQGQRSVGMCRASQYGMNPNYKEEANLKRGIFIQIEHKEGVKNIEEIVSVSGIDGIIIGPYDLSGSYGKPGQIHDPEVEQAIDLILQTCKKHKMTIGIFAKDAKTAKNYLARGFQLVAIGIDIHYLWTSAKEALELLKTH